MTMNLGGFCERHEEWDRDMKDGETVCWSCRQLEERATTIESLTAENARLTSEVERLRVVAEAARVLRGDRMRCTRHDGPDDGSLICRPWSALIDALAALDAAGGEGKR